MNSKKLFSILLLIIVPLVAVSFEGIVTFEMKNKEIGEEALVKWYTKHDNHLLKYATSFEEGNYDYQLLIQSGKQELLMLTEVKGEKGLTRVPFTLLEMQNASWAAANVNKTGVKKVFAGYEAESYRIVAPDKFAICYVSSHPELKNLSLPRILASGGVLRAMNENNIQGAVLFIEVFDLEGNLQYSQSVKNVEKTSIDLSVFDIPQGYPR